MFWLTLAATIIFVAFNAISIRKFGMDTCFSSYGKLWGEAVPIKNMNLWSIVLGSVAFMLIPPVLVSADDNPLQFVGFLTPLYLLLVVFTPDYTKTKKIHIIHCIGAYMCAIGMLIWMIGIMHMWLPLVLFAIAFSIIGYCAKDLLYSSMYYGELTLFLSAFWCLLTY